MGARVGIRSTSISCVVAALATLPMLASCGGTGGSAAVAATRSPATVELTPLFDPPATTAPPATVALTTTPAAPEVTRVPVEPLAEPLLAIGRDSGADAQRVQERLLELGFWLQNPNGDYGVTTRQAVMAFQKYAGLPTTELVDEATAAALSSAEFRVHGISNDGTLIEVDKTRQLLFVIEDDVTSWAINVSTGSGVPFRERDKTEWGKWIWGDAQTPEGIFTIDREYTKGWRPGDLGEIYRPKYFDGGIALHGAYKIPAYPASHGCVRMSTPAMDFIWSADLAPRGTTVWVHSQG
ncbi:MAG: L,D-transpeptidase family protein [Actinomycetota bacterium]